MNLLRTPTSAVLVFGMLASSLLGQHFARSYEVPVDFEPSAAIETSDGSLVLVGSSITSIWLSTDALSMGVDAAGNLRYQAEYRAGFASTRMEDIIPLANGDVLACGHLGASPWIARLDSTGKPVHQQVSSDWVGQYKALCEAPDGTFWVMGWMSGIPDTDLLVGHLDANLQWLGQHTYRFPSASFYQGAIVPLPGGGVVVASTDRVGVSGISDLFVAHIDDQLNLQWAQTVGDTDNESWDAAPRLAVAANGDILVSASQAGSHNNSDDFWVLRLNQQGQTLWEKAYDRGVDLAADLVPLPDNGLIVAGTSSVGNEDFAVLRLDANGDIVWARTLGGDQSESCFALQLLSNGDLLLSGLTKSFQSRAPDPDLWLVRMGQDASLTQGSPWIAPASFSVRTDSTPTQNETAQRVPELIVGGASASRNPLSPKQSVQAVDNFSAWREVPMFYADRNIVPYLAGTGSLEAGEYAAVVLAGAPPQVASFLVVGTQTLLAPLFGGTLVPQPTLILPRSTAALGFDRLDLTWPAGLASNTQFYFQQLIADPSVSSGWVFSNAIEATTP